MTRTHLALFDVGTRKLDTLTSTLADDDSPSWSPDGSRIAFVREAPPEPGNEKDNDIYVIDARAGATPKQLTDFVGPDGGRPAWSPDGKWIAFTRGDEPRFSAYHLNKLTVVPSDGSAPARVVTTTLDRPVSSVRFTADGRSVLATLADDLADPLVADQRRRRLDEASARRSPLGVGLQRPAGWQGSGPHVHARSRDARSTRSARAGRQRQLSQQNDSLFAQLTLASVEKLTSRSKDGTEVHSVLFRPAGVAPGTKLPMVLYIHGGPNGHDGYRFDYDRQFLAAQWL